MTADLLLDELDEFDPMDEPETRFPLHAILVANFFNAGFRTTSRFRDDWKKRAGRVGTTRQFREKFCEAHHYEVDRVVNGRPIRNRVAVVWGWPIVYSLKGGPKPLLGAIAPKGWHLSQVGRSVSPPPLCMNRRS